LTGIRYLSSPRTKVVRASIDTAAVPRITPESHSSQRTAAAENAAFAAAASVARIARINERLEGLGLSKAEVARRVGRDYTYVVELLNGTETSGAPTLALIEDVIEAAHRQVAEGA
jgi:hypothetical protein